MTHNTPPTPSQPFDWQKWLLAILLGVMAAAGGWYLYMQAPQPITISVPAHDFPVYHLITSTDLMKISVLPAELSSETLGSEPDLVGHYTREPLTAGKSVLSTQLAPLTDPALSINTTVVSIPATDAMTFGGRLTSGDVVILWQIPTMTYTTNATPNTLVDQILVLDVLPASSAAVNNAEIFPYVVILAVPIDHQDEILSAAAKGSLVFTLRP